MMAALFAVFVAACVLALTWIDARRIALRDVEIARLNAAREADADEAAATYNALAAEIEALRCGELDAFHDGELPEGRRVAFEGHLVACSKCQAGLADLLYVDAIASTEPASPRGPR